MFLTTIWHFTLLNHQWHTDLLSISRYLAIARELSRTIIYKQLWRHYWYIIQRTIRNMATVVLRIVFLVLVISLVSVSVHSFRLGSRAKTLHFPHQEADDGIKRIRRSVPTENEGPAKQSRTARQADNRPDESAASSGETIEVTKVCVFLLSTLS